MGQDVKQKQPTEFIRGSRFSYDGRSWVVTDYIASPTWRGYDERQWTVQNEQSREVAYLLACESEDNTFNGERWEFTRQITFGEIVDPQNNGRSLAEMTMPDNPPKELTCHGKTFIFKESYTVKAADDDGNKVPKETWDYFDSSGVLNLAFEIWKEPDANYPEVFLGEMIDSAKLAYLGKSVFADKKDFKGFWGVLCIPVFLLFTGVPGDWLLAFFVPFMALSGAYFISPYCFLAVLPIAAVTSGLLMTIFIGMPWLFVGLISVGLVTAGVLFGVSVRNDLVLYIPWLSGFASFIATSIYSFVIYFKVAPAPHNLGQLGATILLPMAIAAVTVLVNWGIGNLWPSIDSNA